MTIDEAKDILRKVYATKAGDIEACAKAAGVEVGVALKAREMVVLDAIMEIWFTSTDRRRRKDRR